MCNLYILYKILWLCVTDLSALSLEDVDSVSEADRDTLAPLPPPHWNNQYPYSSNPSYLPQNLSYIPPYSYTSTDSQSYMGSFVDGDKSVVSGMTGLTAGAGGAGGGNNSAGSVHSASGKLSHGMVCKKFTIVYICNKNIMLWTRRSCAILLAL